MENIAKWKQWQDDNGRIKQIVQSTLVVHLYDHLCLLMPSFLTHSFIKRQQHKSLESDKNSTKEVSGIAVLQMDYTENYRCFSQDEVQNAHWNQKQVTIFTSVTWFQNMKNFYPIVSDCTTHDKETSLINLDRFIQSLQKDIFKLRVWTDGPSSQFKNRFIIAGTQKLQKIYEIAIKWNYSATSHGKGPIDGLVVKRIAPNQVLTRKAIIECYLTIFIKEPVN